MKVLVSGAGIGGLAAARALIADGHEVDRVRAGGGAAARRRRGDAVVQRHGRACPSSACASTASARPSTCWRPVITGASCWSASTSPRRRRATATRTSACPATGCSACSPRACRRARSPSAAPPGRQTKPAAAHRRRGPRHLRRRRHAPTGTCWSPPTAAARPSATSSGAATPASSPAGPPGRALARYRSTSPRPGAACCSSGSREPAA